LDSAHTVNLLWRTYFLAQWNQAIFNWRAAKSIHLEKL